MNVWRLQLRHVFIGSVLIVFMVGLLAVTRNYTLILASKMSAPANVAPIDLAYEYTNESSFNMAHIAFSINVHDDMAAEASFAFTDTELFDSVRKSEQLALAERAALYN